MRGMHTVAMPTSCSAQQNKTSSVTHNNQSINPSAHRLAEMHSYTTKENGRSHPLHWPPPSNPRPTNKRPLTLVTLRQTLPPHPPTPPTLQPDNIQLRRPIRLLDRRPRRATHTQNPHRPALDGTPIAIAAAVRMLRNLPRPLRPAAAAVVVRGRRCVPYDC